MPTSDDEIKRLQRLRDQQLNARAPSAKREKYFKEYRSRHSTRRPTTLKEILDVFSYKWRGFIIGVVLGLLVWLILVAVYHAPWSDWVGIIAMVVFGIMGVITGASFDWRDDIRKL